MYCYEIAWASEWTTEWNKRSEVKWTKNSSCLSKWRKNYVWRNRAPQHTPSVKASHRIACLRIKVCVRNWQKRARAHAYAHSHTYTLLGASSSSSSFTMWPWKVLLFHYYYYYYDCKFESCVCGRIAGVAASNALCLLLHASACTHTTHHWQRSRSHDHTPNYTSNRSQSFINTKRSSFFRFVSFAHSFVSISSEAPQFALCASSFFSIEHSCNSMYTFAAPKRIECVE